MITTILITVCIIAALVALVCCFLTRLELNATRAELEVSTDVIRQRDGEILHLRTQQAHKIDRALWMLIKARSDRLITKPPQRIRAPLTLVIELDTNLVDALASPGDKDRQALIDILGDHLGRRVAKHPMPVTASAPAAQSNLHSHAP
jgi:hypothetical protein